MAAASALKIRVASVLWVARLLVQSASPALGYGTAVACPSPVTGCRLKCVEACNPLSAAVCQTICAWTPPLGKPCVDTFLTFCMGICTAACQTVPSP